ncbi:hypothetical protein [Priestia megaterium]|uniref:hypothetical protein n=1 Tax=Priestia megaterium TaxID=1404 RepID=UPI001D248ECF|nr:hypothetical protein [Priestia megaterium]CAH0305891.1 hypothetical protein SRABI82_04727 [Priestia megaterium]
MPKAKLPPADAWDERNIADWNVTTFRVYLYDRHRELYGLDYVGAVKRDCGMISDMIKKTDKATVKTFIDACFTDYKPTPKYPTLNFYFMKTYMGDRVLPKVLLAQRAERLLEAEELPIEKTESSENINELKGWF